MEEVPDAISGPRIVNLSIIETDPNVGSDAKGAFQNM
jgi:hypothetical protein